MDSILLQCDSDYKQYIYRETWASLCKGRVNCQCIEKLCGKVVQCMYHLKK